MTNLQAYQNIAKLSNGTQAKLFNTNLYTEIDNKLENLFYNFCKLAGSTFTTCENWQQVVTILKLKNIV